MIERRVERQMHVCLSNNVAEEMTNDTAAVLRLITAVTR